MAKRTFEVEFLLAYDDHTWDTKIFKVPIRYNSLKYTNDAIEKWWNGKFFCSALYENVVSAHVYFILPEEEAT